MGEAVGFALPAATGALAYALGVPDAATIPIAVVAGLGEGAVLGFAQSRVLRDEIPRLDVRAWISATAVAGAAGWAVGMPLGVYAGSLPTPVLVAGGIVAGVVLLGAVGTAQWLVLRRYLDRAELWVPANALAWLVGLAVPLTAMSAVSEGDSAARILGVAAASGLGMGVVVAAVTGAALVRLLHGRRRATA